jgi:hypothetical protein
LIFNLYPRVVVKVGGSESHVFDRSRLMFTEVAEIEKVTGLGYLEWLDDLSKYKITAVAALLHILRKREGQPSDFGSLQFNVADLDVVPLHEDGREFTPQEVTEDLQKRVEEAQREKEQGPTSATAAPVAPAKTPAVTIGTSPSSPNGSTSGPSSGTGSPGRTSPRAKRTLTPS